MSQVSIGELRDSLNKLHDIEASVEKIEEALNNRNNVLVESFGLEGTNIAGNNHIFQNIETRSKRISLAIRFDRAIDFRVRLAYIAAGTTNFIVKDYEEVISESGTRRGVFPIEVDFSTARLMIMNDSDEDAEIEFFQVAHFC